MTLKIPTKLASQWLVQSIIISVGFAGDVYFKDLSPKEVILQELKLVRGRFGNDASINNCLINIWVNLPHYFNFLETKMAFASRHGLFDGRMI